jgi:hypothetical protein
VMRTHKWTHKFVPRGRGRSRVGRVVTRWPKLLKPLKAAVLASSILWRVRVFNLWFYKYAAPDGAGGGLCRAMSLR